MSDPATVIGSLAAASPGTLALAEGLSLATLIDPGLVRRMRLLLGGHGPEIEADLYFSDLVRDRSPGGYMLHTGAARMLRQRLAAKPGRLVAVWNCIAARHSTLPPALQAEERLQWHALNGDEARVREILRDCVAALVDPDRPGIAAWAVDAVERFDPEIAELEEFRMLGLGAALRMGASEERIAKLADARLDQWLPWLVPPADSRRKLGVTLVGGGIEFGPAGGTRYPDSIEVPAIHPTTLSVTGEDGRVQYLSMRQNERRAIELPGARFTVANSLGARWQVTSRRARRFIQEKRAPRVHITYKLEAYGTVRKVELPFVVGVLADLSGSPQKRSDKHGKLDFLEFNHENFNERLAKIAPRLALRLGGDEPRLVDLSFRTLDDFLPDRIVTQAPELAWLLRRRQAIQDLLLYLDGKDSAHDLMDRYHAELTERVAEVRRGGYRTARRLLLRMNGDIEKSFAPRDRQRAGRIRTSILILARELAAQRHRFDGSDVFGMIDTVRGQLDAKLSRHMNRIVHHPAFRRLESAWRGLYYLVLNTETGRDLRIRALDIGKDDLHRMLGGGDKPGVERSQLFKSIVEGEFGTSGGEPFGVLLCDFDFGASPPDIGVMEGLAQIGAAAFAPVIANAAPALLDLDDWQQLSDPRDIGSRVEGPVHEGWRRFRESSHSRFLSLAMPRFLARSPYGARTEPVDAFDFTEEKKSVDDHVWIHASYGMGQRIAEAFTLYGWCTRIRGVETGGTLSNLPAMIFEFDAVNSHLRATEVAISDRREADLAKAGLLALVARINTDTATFIGGQTVHKPPKYDSPEDDMEAALASRLSYLFPICRFAHYIMCMDRDYAGGSGDSEVSEHYLNSWILQYVDAQPDSSMVETAARMPLKYASVRIASESDRPGYRLGRLDLTAGYQLEGLNVPMSVELRLKGR